MTVMLHDDICRIATYIVGVHCIVTFSAVTVEYDIIAAL